MAAATVIKPGSYVTGRFYSDGRYGVGIVVERGRPLWTRVGEGYVPVRVIKGDRIDGGYNPDDLIVLECPKETR